MAPACPSMPSPTAVSAWRAMAVSFVTKKKTCLTPARWSSAATESAGSLASVSPTVSATADTQGTAVTEVSYTVTRDVNLIPGERHRVQLGNTSAGRGLWLLLWIGSHLEWYSYWLWKALNSHHNILPWPSDILPPLDLLGGKVSFSLLQSTAAQLTFSHHPTPLPTGITNAGSGTETTEVVTLLWFQYRNNFDLRLDWFITVNYAGERDGSRLSFQATSPCFVPEIRTCLASSWHRFRCIRQYDERACGSL